MLGPSGDPFKVIEPPDARLLMTLRVAGRGVHAAAVRSLSFMPGGGGAGAAEDCLLVFGGQGQSEPDMLALLPLTAQPDGDGGGRQVPWFGNIKGLCTVRPGCLHGLRRLHSVGQLVTGAAQCPAAHAHASSSGCAGSRHPAAACTSA